MEMIGDVEQANGKLSALFRIDALEIKAIDEAINKFTQSAKNKDESMTKQMLRLHEPVHKARSLLNPS